MSIVAKEAIEVIAQGIGINNLSADAALSLATDVEYRMREIMQLVYGFASEGPLQFKRAVGHRDLFYIDDKDVDLKDVIEAPLPKAPLDTGVVCHWLAIEGVQPAIPENAPVGVIASPSDGKTYEQKDELPVDIKLPVKHVLSRELQLYFDKITELIVRKSDSALFKEALVSRGLNDYSLLFALMCVVWSLLQNPHIHVEPYLHQLMPSVVTCLISKKLGNRIADNHWELRDFTANLVASICKRNLSHDGLIVPGIYTRLTKTLLNALLDPKRALTQHYDAIQGLVALGPYVVRLLILPNLEPYLRLLEPELLLEKKKNEMKRYEVWQVYGALLCAAGQGIYDRLKIFPPLPSPPGHAGWKSREKVVTAVPNKRKATMDPLEHEQPLKKIATDGPIGLFSANSSPSPIQGETVAPLPSGDFDADQPSSSEKMPNDERLGNRVGKDTQVLKKSAMLNQVWKEDLSSGRTLVSLFELFGEGILSFIPVPEMSLFLWHFVE
ncbi:hypothetical protein REPUB_Repub17cG0028400 [Reevesia pubescens]